MVNKVKRQFLSLLWGLKICNDHEILKLWVKAREPVRPWACVRCRNNSSILSVKGRRQHKVIFSHWALVLDLNRVAETILATEIWQVARQLQALQYAPHSMVVLRATGHSYEDFCQNSEAIIVSFLLFNCIFESRLDWVGLGCWKLYPSSWFMYACIHHKQGQLPESLWLADRRAAQIHNMAAPGFRNLEEEVETSFKKPPPQQRVVEWHRFACVLYNFRDFRFKELETSDSTLSHLQSVILESEAFDTHMHQESLWKEKIVFRGKPIERTELVYCRFGLGFSYLLACNELVCLTVLELADHSEKD